MPAKTKTAKTARRTFLTAHNLAAGAAGLFACAILVNALFMQEQRHPSPLLRIDPETATPSAAPDAAPAMPLPAPRPAALSAAKSQIAKPETAAAPAKPAAVKAETREADAIGDEIQRASSAPERKPRDSIAGLLGGTQAVAESNPAVLGAQKALVKLGYVLRADGVFGGTTRQAIERFERDNGMPVQGDLTPKLSKLLSAKSGVGAQ